MSTVIISGGTIGIGSEIAKKFLEEHWYVLIASRNKKGLANTSNKRLKFHQLDVRKESDHLSVMEYARDWTGQLDCVVNCAGYSKWSPITKVSESFWTTMIDTNLKGCFWGCKTAATYLDEGGCIINVSSLAGKRGSANNSVYCASKFGINGLTQALAKELGRRQIRVNAVCPVYVETPGLMKALQASGSPSTGKNVAEYLDAFAIEQAALQRLPTTREIADTCFFLASPTASAITGQCVNVDCGVMPQ